MAEPVLFKLNDRPINFILNGEVESVQDNSRILEDGFFRLLENGSFRLLEGATSDSTFDSTFDITF